MNRVLVAVEFNDEIADVEFILNQMVSRGAHIEKAYFLPRAMTSKIIGTSSRIFAYHPWHALKPAWKIIHATILLAVMLVFRPNIIITGGSSLKVRLWSRILRIKHLAYYRGILFDPHNQSGFGDFVRYRILRGHLDPYLFNSYRSDYVITISKLNYEFISQRVGHTETIFLVPPPWLHHTNILPTATDRKANETIYFITQAFDYHGHHKQQEEQTRIIAILWEALQKAGINFRLRAHPRDRFDYEKAYPGLQVDREPSLRFLASLSRNDIILSPLSTIAFEFIHLGGRCIFYSSPLISAFYARSYQRLDIKPLWLDPNDEDEDLASRLLESTGHRIEVFSEEESYSEIYNHVFLAK